jgi:RNA polymerase sigma factor for flagellar operon FliA
MNALVGHYRGRSSPDEMKEEVLRYLPLVRHVVRRIAIHLPKHVDLEDLESVGVIGLMEAVRRYDASRGCSLKTFAFEHVRGAVLSELRARDVVTRPMRKKIRELEKVESKLAGILGRPPQVTEIAEEMTCDDQVVESILLARHTHALLSLDVSDPNREGQALVAGMVCRRTRDPQEIASHREDIERLADAIAELPEVEQQVLVLYYSKNLYQREIGEVLGVTESRVCQIHASAVKRLEKKLKNRMGEAGA